MTAFILLSTFLSACSLTGVTDVRVGECESDQECREALNDPDYIECARWECVDNGEYKQCKEITEEICDNLDNNCNYLIDEPNETEVVVTPKPPQVFAKVAKKPRQVSVLSSAAIEGAYIQTADGASYTAKKGGNPMPVQNMTNATDIKGLDRNLVEGCRGKPIGNVSAVLECSAAESAVAAGAQQGFFASIVRQGCSSGTLRVGAIDPTIPQEFIDRGPAIRAPTWLGVAVHSETRCTNNGSGACEAAIEAWDAAQGKEGADLTALRLELLDRCGATSPAIASLTDQALITFLAAPSGSNTCDKATDIKAMVLQERIGLGAPYYWVAATNEGIPEHLGTTLGGEAPAILPIEERGFLVAFSDEQGMITIRWLEKQPPSGGSSRNLSCTGEECLDRTGIETAPLTSWEDVLTLPSKGASGVHLSWLDEKNDDAGDSKIRRGALAVSWSEGCSDTSLHNSFVQVLQLDISEDGVPSVLKKHPQVSLDTSKSTPVLIAQESGFVAPGLPHGKKVTKENTGGFYAITHGKEMQARRITAFDGQLVAPGEVIPLGGAHLTPMQDFSSNSPQLMSYDSDAGALSLTTFECK